MKPGRPILLVEDDKIDAMSVQRAHQDLKITNPLVHVVDGEKALEYLRSNREQLPHIILLDLNMPRMNGFELLEVIKNDPEFRRVPVIILTTSQNQQDRIESFNLNVAGYMIKPVGYLRFVEVIRTIDTYWTLSEAAY